MKNFWRWTLAVCLALLPPRWKPWVYRRLLGYQIGPGVRIGLSLFVGVKQCGIGRNTRIGHFNLFIHIDELKIGESVRIGHLNIFRGGRRVEIRDYATILRLNVFNSIPDAEVVNPTEPTLELGTASVVTTGHWLDFTDRITIGDHTILGGRNSSLWTHNRQRTRPIRIGHHCYLGSDIRIAPGVVVPPFCIVSLGAVLMDRFEQEFSLIGGNPARVLRPLTERDLFLVTHKTRPDLPGEVARELLPDRLKGPPDRE